MCKDTIKKLKHSISSRRLSSSRIRRMWIRHGLVASLVFLAVSASVLTFPGYGSAAEPFNETHLLPSPTPIQVTPPPTGQLTQTQSLPPPFAGIPMWAMAGITLLVLAVILFLYVRQHRRPALGPFQIASVPFLKSTDGSLYFRLDGLNEDGLIIGRGKHNVDLRIEEAIPHVDTVSTQHARIYYNPTYGNVIIEDLHSTNGIFINGRQAPRKNLLKDGWVVSLGSINLTFHDGESDTGPLD